MSFAAVKLEELEQEAAFKEAFWYTKIPFYEGLDKELVTVFNNYRGGLTLLSYATECLLDPMLVNFIDKVANGMGIKTNSDGIKGFSMENVLKS
ncbi:MAG: hypothetical protein V1818_01050 [Candidatus Aenigmatarchaeota archaeon]